MSCYIGDFCLFYIKAINMYDHVILKIIEMSLARQCLAFVEVTTIPLQHTKHLISRKDKHNSMTSSRNILVFNQKCIHNFTPYMKLCWLICLKYLHHTLYKTINRLTGKTLTDAIRQVHIRQINWMGNPVHKFHGAVKLCHKLAWHYITLPHSDMTQVTWCPNLLATWLFIQQLVQALMKET